MTVHKYDYGFLSSENYIRGWYPVEYTEHEDKRDLDAEQEDWERTLEKYENEPDIPL